MSVREDMSGYAHRRFLADRRRESVNIVSIAVNKAKTSSTNLDILPETRGVVVSSGLSITEGFEYGIRSENLPLHLARLIKGDFGLEFGFGGGRVDGSEVSHDVLGLEAGKQPSQCH